MTQAIKPKNRCPFPNCNKKLQLTDMQCKCELIFCALHRLPEAHQCTFNHGGAELLRLAERLSYEKVARPKVREI